MDFAEARVLIDDFIIRRSPADYKFYVYRYDCKEGVFSHYVVEVHGGGINFRADGLKTRADVYRYVNTMITLIMNTKGM